MTAETSAQLRERLRPADGSPTLVSFSRGKDAIAALLALRESGHDVRCYHLDLPPGLGFVDRSLARLEESMHLGPTLRLPHPALYRHVNAHTFHSPDMLDAAERSMIWGLRWTYADVVEAARLHFGLAPNAWVADGVRAADSPLRGIVLRKHGGANEKRRQFSAVWDWTADMVEAIIRRHGVRLPIDYRLWGRTWDGVDARFMGPLRDHLPDDYARVLEWYPMADIGLFREEKMR